MSIENQSFEQSNVVDINDAPSAIKQRHADKHRALLEMRNDLNQRDSIFEKGKSRNRARALGMYVVKGDK
jgi:hypothetical protein